MGVPRWQWANEDGEMYINCIICIYIYIRVYTYVYVNIYTYTCVYIYILIFTYFSLIYSVKIAEI